MRAYIACLAAYNAGRLHGEWFDVSTDPDVNAANIAQVLRSSPCPNVTLTDPETGKTYPSAEEYAVHDYDDAGALADVLGEYPTAQRLADAARLIEEIGDYGDETLTAAILDAMLDGNGDDLGDLADNAEDWIADHFAGTGDNLTDWVETFLEETGQLERIPEDLRRYFDFESFARDMKCGGEVFTVDLVGSVAVFWNR